MRQLSGHQSERDRPSLTGAPVGHAIGMLGGLMCPLVIGRPLYLIDGWDPPTVLNAMVEEQIAAGSGSTYFFTSLLDCPGFGPEHVELMRYIELLEQCLGKQAQKNLLPLQVGDVPATWADITDLARDVGYAPT